MNLPTLSTFDPPPSTSCGLWGNISLGRSEPHVSTRNSTLIYPWPLLQYLCTPRDYPLRANARQRSFCSPPLVRDKQKIFRQDKFHADWISQHCLGFTSWRPGNQQPWACESSNFVHAWFSTVHQLRIHARLYPRLPLTSLPISVYSKGLSPQGECPTDFLLFTLHLRQVRNIS